MTEPGGSTPLDAPKPRVAVAVVGTNLVFDYGSPEAARTAFAALSVPPEPPLLVQAAAFMLNLIDEVYGTDNEGMDLPEEAEYRRYAAVIHAAIEAGP